MDNHEINPAAGANDPENQQNGTAHQGLPADTYSEITNKDTARNQHDSNANPEIVAPIWPVRIWRRFLDWENDPFRQRAHWSDFATMGLTIAIIIIGAAQACIYHGQLKVMGGQLAEMQGSGKQTDQMLCLIRQQLEQITKQTTDTHELATQAKNQADRTKEIAETSRDALISVQRAFVFAIGFEGVRIGDPNDATKIAYLDFSITWENNGTTPTRHMTQHYSWLTPIDPLPDNYSYPDLGDTKLIPVTLGPKAVGHTTPIRIPADTITRIVNHQQHLYIWGWVRYRDIFAKSKPHITRYCTEVVGFDGNPTSVNPNDLVKPVLSNCGGNNCYDEECKVQ